MSYAAQLWVERLRLRAERKMLDRLHRFNKPELRLRMFLAQARIKALTEAAGKAQTAPKVATLPPEEDQ